MSRGDRILCVKRVLIDVARVMESEQRAAPGQIERQQSLGERRVRLEPRSGALADHGQRGIRNAGSAVVDAGRVEARIGDAELEIFEQPRLLQIDTILNVVAALCGRDVGFDSPVEKLPLLALRRWSIVKSVPARKIVELVLADIRI